MFRLLIKSIFVFNLAGWLNIWNEGVGFTVLLLHDDVCADQLSGLLNSQVSVNTIDHHLFCRLVVTY